MDMLDQIENAAREQNRTSGSSERQIGEHSIKCQLTSAMTRRAYGYSDDVGRANWYVDGKFVSRATAATFTN